MKNTSPRTQALLIPAAILLALVLPSFLTDFQIFQSTQILIFAIAILGLNLLTGFNGQISLGHGAFYAIGAYAFAILVQHFGVHYALSFPLAAVICFAFGFLFGLPALRLHAHYLALATFALAIAVPQMLKHKLLEPWTGGVAGISLMKPDAPFGLPVNPDQWLYYLTLLVTIVLFYLARNLLRGRVGRAIKAIRDYPVAAESMGVNASLYKTLTFGVSATYTGLAGALSAMAIQYVSPDSFTMFLSIYLLVGLVIGGVGAVPGAFLGAAFIVIIPNVANDVSKSATGAIYGLFLVVVVYLMPNGAWGALTQLSNFLMRRKDRRSDAAPSGRAETSAEAGPVARLATQKDG